MPPFVSLSEAYSSVLLKESRENSVQQLALVFYLDFLKNNPPPKNSVTWITEQFVTWAKNRGVVSKAAFLYHHQIPRMCPVVDNFILDFSFHTLNPSFNQPCKITETKYWKSTYSPYHYGTSTITVNNKQYTALIGSYKTLSRLLQNITT